MKHFKLLVLFAVLVLCLVSSSADAILAGVNPDIRNDTGVVANDFHIEGKIKSGWPYMNWQDPPTLVHHIDGIFPEFSYSITPDSSSLWQNEFTFTAHWKGVDIAPGEIIHLGLVFDLYCNNLIIDLEGWWTRDGERIAVGLNNGSVIIPGFDVKDTGLDPVNPDNSDLIPQHIRIQNDSGVQIPATIMGMEVAVVKPSLVDELFDGSLVALFDHLNQEMQGALPVEWREVPQELFPPEFGVESFFDVFFEIEVPTPDGSGLEPLVPDFQPGDILIDRIVIEYPGNDGVSSWRWTWHMHQSHELDFGDAPVIDDSVGYPTLLAQDGARHIIQGPWFGDRSDRPDPERDGQPEPAALGDDTFDLNDDEDGIVIPVLTVGATSTIQVEVSNGGGFVKGWIDWDQDRQWSAAELVVSTYLATGSHSLNVTVPSTAVTGQTFARFRIVAPAATGASVAVDPVGLARSGEVEDHEVKIVEPEPIFDFGDAPDRGPVAAGYPTLLVNNGARHYPRGPWLGPDDDNPDLELDGQPNATATGDDLLDLNDDEDGVSIPLLIAGQTVVVKFSVSGGGGVVEGWIDFDHSTSWDASELIVNGSYPDGTHGVNVTVPAGSVPGQSYARFRISSNGTGSPEGEAADGEVEDYLVDIEEPQAEYDWGDAPDNADMPGYPTLMANNGANHMIGGPWLGPDDDSPDVEADGQPTNAADGDDLDGNDDEDGLKIPILVAGKSGDITLIVNGGGGYVTGWIDYDQSMSWELSELVVNGSYSDGVHTITVNVPFDAVYGKTYARFRIVRTDVLPITPSPEGPAANGEVEDYILEIKDPCHWPLNADIDGDGKVDLVDFSIMATQWLDGVSN